MPLKIKNQIKRSPRVATVEVPGTTANLGTGFDALGIALGVANHCRVRRLPGKRIEWAGVSASARRMMREAAKAFFKKARCKSFGFSLDVRGNVPVARGLGSSVTVRL